MYYIPLNSAVVVNFFCVCANGDEVMIEQSCEFCTNMVDFCAPGHILYSAKFWWGKTLVFQSFSKENFWQI